MRNPLFVGIALITLILVEGISVGQTEAARVARLDTVAALDGALDLRDPKIVVHYYYVSGDQPCKLRLPADDEIGAFFGIMVEADGKRLDPVDPTVAFHDLVFSRAVELKPGESAAVTIPIGKIYKMPVTWKKLVVTPVPMSAVRGIIAGVMISNNNDL